MDVIKPIFTKEERYKQIINSAIRHQLVKNHLLEINDISAIENDDLRKRLIKELMEIGAKEAESDIRKQIEAMENLHKYIPQYKD